MIWYTLLSSLSPLVPTVVNGKLVSLWLKSVHFKTSHIQLFLNVPKNTLFQKRNAMHYCCNLRMEFRFGATISDYLSRLDYLVCSLILIVDPPFHHSIQVLSSVEPNYQGAQVCLPVEFPLQEFTFFPHWFNWAYWQEGQVLVSGVRAHVYVVGNHAFVWLPKISITLVIGPPPFQIHSGTYIPFIWMETAL